MFTQKAFIVLTVVVVQKLTFFSWCFNPFVVWAFGITFAPLQNGNVYFSIVLSWRTVFRQCMCNFKLNTDLWECFVQLQSQNSVWCRCRAWHVDLRLKEKVSSNTELASFKCMYFSWKSLLFSGKREMLLQFILYSKLFCHSLFILSIRD